MSTLKQTIELAPCQPQHRAIASEIGDKVAVSKGNTLAPNRQNQTHQPTAVIQRKPGEDEELSVQRMLIGSQNSTLQAFRPAHTNNTYSSPGKLPFIQKKLTVNTPGDEYEQEADTMADKAMRMKDPFLPPSNDTFFKKQTAAPIQRKCAACGEEDKYVHRKENSATETQGSGELDNYIGSLGSSGNALLESSRQFFEPRFGQDFSNVRIHTDSIAAKSAQSINALAYTTGNNIVFNHRQYSPGSEAGQRLMAHELTHVMQQGMSKQSIQKTEANETLDSGSTQNDNYLNNLNLAAPVTLKENRLVPGDVQTVNGKKYVVYDDEIRQGGTVAWVTRNPGNIRLGQKYGAIPNKKYHTDSVGDFSIFPDETTGFIAIIKLLQDYGHVTVSQAMNKYAPASDGSNNPTQYATTVASKMGVSVTTFIDTLSDEQLSVFADAIKQVEGWRPGNTFSYDSPNLPKSIKDFL